MSTSNENRPNGDLANRYKTLILGAGISGLSKAWEMQKRGESSFAVLERSSRVGGWVQTHEEEGFLFERGPRSCRASGGESTLQLAKEVGLEEEIIWADKSAAQRYLYAGGQLRALPSRPYHLLTNRYGRLAIGAILRDLRTAPSELQDESIFDFARRRFGEKVARQLIDPVTAGIYAGDPKELSMRSCFPSLFRWEKERGSVVKGAFRKRGKGGLFSFRRGMESLPKAIAEQLTCPIHLGCEIKALRFYEGGVELVSSDATFHCERLYSTLPPYLLARLIDDPELEMLLAQTPSLSLAVVHLGYHDNVLDRKGFGYLIPRDEGEEILGCVWDSSVFPQQNRSEHETRLSVMIAGDSKPFSEIALRAVHKQLGIYYTPDCLTVFPASHAIPQYRVGHASRLAEIERILKRGYPQLTLAGNGFYGVSLNECTTLKKWADGRGEEAHQPQRT